MVGIFWLVDGVIVSKTCPMSEAVEYGDCLTFEGGHAETWERWQCLGSAGLVSNNLPGSILTSEYEAHPRGRVVKEPERFVIYADRRLQKRKYIDEICVLFALSPHETVVRNDPHYRPFAFD
jgi:hypothetical protein